MGHEMTTTESEKGLLQKTAEPQNFAHAILAIVAQLGV